MAQPAILSHSGFRAGRFVTPTALSVIPNSLVVILTTLVVIPTEGRDLNAP